MNGWEAIGANLLGEVVRSMFGRTRPHPSMVLAAAAALVLGCSETVSLGQGVPGEALDAGTRAGRRACEALRPRRVPPSGDDAVTQVGAGGKHTCFLHANGSVACTGDNGFQQLGRGMGPGSLVPVLVTDLDDAVDMDVGPWSTCAVRSDGSVTCWGGESATGGLATGPVTGVDDAVQVRTAGNHVCALTTDGRVQCWGWNMGQLGIVTSGSRELVTTPTYVAGLDDAVQIDVALQISCAIRATCEVVCWGSRATWGLEAGEDPVVESPTPIEGATEIESLSVSQTTVCGVRTDGTLRCWGNNTFGQLGYGCDGSACLPSPIAQRVPTIGFAKGVAVGLNHTCVLDGTNQVLCFGRLGDILGDDTTLDIPQPVAGLGDAVALGTTTSSHQCAIRASGRVSCWGWGENGQLGDGTGLNSAAPVDVVGL